MYQGNFQRNVCSIVEISISIPFETRKFHSTLFTRSFAHRVYSLSRTELANLRNFRDFRFFPRKRRLRRKKFTILVFPPIYVESPATRSCRQLGDTLYTRIRSSLTLFLFLSLRFLSSVVVPFHPTHSQRW